jgi:hypothetical protein
MLKAKQAKEIKIRTPNEIEVLTTMSKLISDKGINILAMNAWVEGSDAVLRLLTEDNLRTSDVLRQHGYDVQEEGVILIEAPHKAGILRHVAESLAKEGIALTHLYASATIDQDVCLVVVDTSDNERAFVLLND